MLRILQARFQQYVNQGLHVQVGFQKGRGTRDQIANICWIKEKAKESQKNIYFCFIDYTKAFDYVHHNKLWKNFKELGIPDNLICLKRNLYTGQVCMYIFFYIGQEATFKLDMENRRVQHRERRMIRLYFFTLLI